MMSELQSVARLKIHDDKLDELKRLAAESPFWQVR